MSSRSLAIGLAAGVAITPIALILAVISGGAGHGHYEFARLLFPFTMLLTRLAENRITLPLVMIAFIQFPCYGAIVGGYASQRRKILVVSGLIFLAHAVAAATCFLGGNSKLFLTRVMAQKPVAPSLLTMHHDGARTRESRCTVPATYRSTEIASA